jgi:hypothetical protein
MWNENTIKSGCFSQLFTKAHGVWYQNIEEYAINVRPSKSTVNPLSF